MQPDTPRCAAHDALTRLLQRLVPDPTPLWNEARQHVVLHDGLLSLDDTTLDKLYAQQIELVPTATGRATIIAWSRVSTWSLCCGVMAQTPSLCDYRFYDKPVDGVTKNEHFRAMLTTAKQRGFHPRLVAFDSWYSSLENLKTVRSFDWHWLRRLKRNRQVNPDGTGNRALQLWAE